MASEERQEREEDDPTNEETERQRVEDHCTDVLDSHETPSSSRERPATCYEGAFVKRNTSWEQCPFRPKTSSLPSEFTPARKLRGREEESSARRTWQCG